MLSTTQLSIIHTTNYFTIYTYVDVQIAGKIRIIFVYTKCKLLKDDIITFLACTYVYCQRDTYVLCNFSTYIHMFICMCTEKPLSDTHMYTYVYIVNINIYVRTYKYVYKAIHTHPSRRCTHIPCDLRTRNTGHSTSKGYDHVFSCYYTHWTNFNICRLCACIINI